MNREWFKQKANAAFKEGARLLSSRAPRDLVAGIHQSFSHIQREIDAVLMGAQPSTLADPSLERSQSRPREWRPGSAVEDCAHHAAEFIILEKLLTGIRSEQVRKEFSAIGEESYTNTEEIRIWVGTYNVNGRKPPDSLDLSDWIQAWENNWPDRPGEDGITGADICVMGFQEIVPLNPQNIIGGGLNAAHTAAWDTAIEKVLNPWKDFSSIFPTEAEISKSSRGFQADVNVVDLLQGWAVGGSMDLGKASWSGSQHNGSRNMDAPSEAIGSRNLDREISFAANEDSLDVPDKKDEGDGSREDEFVQVISKQLVGLYMSVWVRRRLLPKISGIQTTSVATGAMGYLANKGAIAARMRVNDSSIVFLTSHFASGSHSGDELRRNLDFSEIMRRAVFPFEMKVGLADDMDGLPDGAGREVQKAFLGGEWGSLRKLQHHENIIWFGDLNYRIKAETAAVIQTIRNGSLHKLYDRDELSIERNAGRVFKGFKEGPVTFDPTYKYVRGTDFYTGEGDEESSSSSDADPDVKASASFANSFRLPSMKEDPNEFLGAFDRNKAPAMSSASQKKADDVVSRLNLSTRGAAPKISPDIPRKKPVVQRFSSERGGFGSAPTTPPGSPKKKSKKRKKIRTPSWTDRVLYYSSGRLHHLLYGCCGDLKTSDHKPVQSAFLLQSRCFDRKAVEQHVEQCREIVNKREMANIPRCKVEPSGLNIGKVHYKQTVEHTIVATNVGEVTATFGFIPPPHPVNETVYSKLGALPPWVTAAPLAGDIAPGESVEIQLKIRVIGGKWGSANEIACSPNCCMDEVLVLRIEGGSDFFINISGTYVPSCFGLSLEYLASKSCPKPDSRSLRSHRIDLASMRNRTSDPLELVKKFDAEKAGSKAAISQGGTRTLAPFSSITRTGPMPNLVEGPIGEMVPSQLSRMLVYVCEKDRLMTKGIFVDTLDDLLIADRTGIADSDVALIRKCLDNGTAFPFGLGAKEMAKAILSFFRDLPAPLIPESVAHAVEEASLSSDQAISLTKEAMSAIEWGVMRTTLEVLRTALTEEYSAENKLTITSLARVLAEVWFQPSVLESGVNYSEELLLEIGAKESMYTQRRASYMEGFLLIPGEKNVASKKMGGNA